jgi:hypothetical protein
MSWEKVEVAGVRVWQSLYRKQAHPRGHAEYIVGRSDLCEVLDCPHRWLMSGEREDADTEATLFGSLVDSMLCGVGLEGFAHVPETYVDAKTGEAKPWTFAANVCKEWARGQEGKLLVKNAIWTDAEAAVESARRSEAFVRCIDGAAQVMLLGRWRDHDTGAAVLVKSLIDVVPKARKAALVDVKTTRDASPRAWARRVWDSGYHVQAALYLDMWNALAPSDIAEKIGPEYVGERSRWLWPIVENAFPFEVVVREAAPEWIKLGRAHYKSALGVYASCLACGEWPGYDHETEVDGISQCSPEAWLMLAARGPIEDDPIPEALR